MGSIISISIAGVVLERTALATGFLAACIAVGVFLARAQVLLGGDRSIDLQRQMAIGGLFGFSFGVLVIVTDAVVS